MESEFQTFSPKKKWRRKEDEFKKELRKNTEQKKIINSWDNLSEALLIFANNKKKYIRSRSETTTKYVECVYMLWKKKNSFIKIFVVVVDRFSPFFFLCWGLNRRLKIKIMNERNEMSVDLKHDLISSYVTNLITWIAFHTSEYRKKKFQLINETLISFHFYEKMRLWNANESFFDTRRRD